MEGFLVKFFTTIALLAFGNEAKDPKVFLTVSSLAWGSALQQVHQRELILNYYDADCERMSRSYPFIGLFTHDPKLNPKHHMILTKPGNCPQGKIMTNVSFPLYKFNNDNLTHSECLGYWAAYFESGHLVDSSCISTHPDWMYNIKDYISEKTLNSIMIPGTHDSGCYSQYDPFKNTVYEKYVYTQDENIFTQLVYGNRLLDLRIWSQKSLLWKNKITITHDVHHIGLPDLEDVLMQVKEFVSATNEIVIIDFHRKLTGVFMVGPTEEWQDKEVIQLLKNIFGSLLIDNKYKYFPIKKLWEMNKRVLITFTAYHQRNLDDLITFQVRHWWTDVQNTRELHKYLLEHACSSRYELSAAVAVLTPNIWMPVIDIHYSRRVSSDEANEVLNKWFRNELSCANIVLTDYFLGNDVIEIAIQENKKKYRH